MLIGVYEETWPWPVRRNSLPTTQRPVGAADGHAAARALAKEMARKFDHSDFVGEHDYWWGHDQDAPQLYRYVITCKSPAPVWPERRRHFYGERPPQ